MKITIFLILLAIVSPTSIDIFNNVSNSHNPSNQIILNYRFATSNLKSIQFTDVGSSFLFEGSKHTNFPSSIYIVIAIMCFLVLKGRLNEIWRYHLIGFIVYMLLIQAQSQCPTNPNCSVCNSSGCSSCINSSYFVTSGPPTCKLCSTAITSCKECNSNTNCTVCASGFHTILNNSQCLNCAGTIGNCINCTRLINSSVVFCDSCTSSMFPLNNFTINTSICTPCHLYLNACITCVNINTCTLCANDSFGLSTTTKKCYPCSLLRYGCNRCNSSYCFECQPFFEMEPNNRCLRCSDLMDGCVNCSHSSFCINCIPKTYYLDILDNFCYICDFKFPYCQQCTYTECKVCKTQFYLSVDKLCVCKKGKLLGTVCNPVPGCTKANIYNKTSVCKACKDQFIFNIRTFYCDCRVGIPVGDTCTHIYGCITLYTNPDNMNLCLMCDIQQNFYLKDNQCFCKDGFTLNKTSEKCTDTCGDGRIFTAQCDDGNPHNGDGCSNSCLIENLFRCYNGSFNSSSKCLYMGSPFGLKLFSIYKKPESNTGVFVFTITEWIPLIEHIQEDLESIEFNTTQEDVISEVKHDKGKLYVTVQYFEDLEGNMAKFSIDLANFFLTSRVIVVDFAMISETAPLVIMDYPPADLLRYLEWVLLAAVSIAILLLTVGSLFHKMVGLETIVVFQTCFLLPYVITDGSVVLSCFKVLSYSTGYGKQLFYDKERDKYLHESNVKLQLPKQFFEAMAVNSMYFIGIAILMAVLSLIALVLEKKKKKNKVNRKIGVTIYHRMLFPTSMAFFSICFFSILSNSIRVYEWEQTTQLIVQTTSNFDYISQYINFGMAALLSIIIMSIASLQIILSLKAQQVSIPNKIATDYHPVHLLTNNPDLIKAKRTYVGIFLINMIITMSFLSGFVIHQFHISIYILSGLYIFSTIIFIIYMPYLSKIHTAGLLFGQFILILFSSGLSVKQYFLNSHKALPLIYQLYYCSLIAAFLLIFDILSIIRLIYEKIQERKSKQNKNNSKQLEEEYMHRGKKSKYDRLIDQKWNIEDTERKKPSFQTERQENDELKQIKSRLKNDLSSYIRKESEKKLSLTLNFSQY